MHVTNTETAHRGNIYLSGSNFQENLIVVNAYGAQIFNLQSWMSLILRKPFNWFAFVTNGFPRLPPLEMKNDFPDKKFCKTKEKCGIGRNFISSRVLNAEKEKNEDMKKLIEQ